MNLNDLKGRIRRLEELSMKLAREETRVRKGDDPLLFVERRAYLAALWQAISGVEGTRVALVKARQRLEED